MPHSKRHCLLKNKSDKRKKTLSLNYTNDKSFTKAKKRRKLAKLGRKNSR